MLLMHEMSGKHSIMQSSGCILNVLSKKGYTTAFQDLQGTLQKLDFVYGFCLFCLGQKVYHIIRFN